MKKIIPLFTSLSCFCILLSALLTGCTSKSDNGSVVDTTWPVSTLTDSGSNIQFSMAMYGNTTYVAYIDNANLKLATSSDGGATWSRYDVDTNYGASYPSIAVTGDYIVILYETWDEAETSQGILAARSTDNGTSWNIVSTGYTTPTRGSIAVDGNTVLYYQTNNGTGYDCLNSLDGGISWSTTHVTDTSVIYYGRVAATAVSGSRIKTLIVNPDNGALLLYETDDGGATGTREIIATLGYTSAVYPSLAFDSNYVYVTFRGSGSFNDYGQIFAKRPIGGGAWDFTTVDERGEYGEIFVNSGALNIVYYNLRDDAIKKAASQDNGETWSLETVVTGISSLYGMDSSFDGEDFHVVFNNSGLEYAHSDYRVSGSEYCYYWFTYDMGSGDQHYCYTESMGGYSACQEEYNTFEASYPDATDGPCVYSCGTYEAGINFCQ